MAQPDFDYSALPITVREVLAMRLMTFQAQRQYTTIDDSSPVRDACCDALWSGYEAMRANLQGEDVVMFHETLTTLRNIRKVANFFFYPEATYEAV